MKTNVANEVQDTSTAMKALIGTYLNNRYFQVLRAINWMTVRNDYTVTTSAGTQEYVLSDDFGKELAVVDDTTQKEITKIDYQLMIMEYPSTYSTQGTVKNYYIREDLIKAQPTSASALAIVSSSASDTTQVVLVRGISSSSEITEEVTLNGATPAATTNSFTRIKAISKSAVTVGTVTITSNSGAVTNAVLVPEVLETRYKFIGFYSVPSSAQTVRVPYTVKPLPMTEDYDYPVIDIADLLEDGAKADAWRYKKMFAKAGVFETLFAAHLDEFIWDNHNDPNRVYQFMPSTFNKENLY